jgi:hypothetical protein
LTSSAATSSVHTRLVIWLPPWIYRLMVLSHRAR